MMVLRAAEDCIVSVSNESDRPGQYQSWTYADVDQSNDNKDRQREHD